MFTCILWRCKTATKQAYFETFAVLYCLLMLYVTIGDLLIIIAMIISASQFVYEEKFIKKHNFYPLLVVGLEGLMFIYLHILLYAMKQK